MSFSYIMGMSLAAICISSQQSSQHLTSITKAHTCAYDQANISYLSVNLFILAFNDVLMSSRNH